MSLSDRQASSPEQRLDPWPLTVEFCRQLACPHNGSAAPKQSLRAAQVPGPAPEPVYLNAVKPTAMFPPIQAPMLAAAVPSQLLSIALSSGQLTYAVPADKVGAQVAVVMPERAPAPAPSPQAAQQPVTALGPVGAILQTDSAQDSSASSPGMKIGLTGNGNLDMLASRPYEKRFE